MKKTEKHIIFYLLCIHRWQ